MSAVQDGKIITPCFYCGGPADLIITSLASRRKYEACRPCFDKLRRNSEIWLGPGPHFTAQPIPWRARQP